MCRPEKLSKFHYFADPQFIHPPAMPPNSELVRMIEEAAAAASPSRAHIAAVQLEVDAGADVVAAVTKVQALFRGRTGRMRVAHDGSRLGTQLDRAQSALSTLQLAMESSSEQSKPNMIGELRTFVHQTSKLLSCAQSSLALRIALDDGHQRTTRTNYLIPLNERIGQSQRQEPGRPNGTSSEGQSLPKSCP